jgi:FHA domain-containing protein
MQTIRCAPCDTSFQMSADSLRGRSTVHCPGCGRIVIVPGSAEAAPGDDPDTDAYLEPAPPGEVPTAVGAARALLSLPAGLRVSITVLSGDRQGDVIVLDEPSIVIGRGGGADVDLPDPDVSRRHAAVDCHGMRIVLRDLGSRMGTFVDEQRVDTADLHDRSEFRLGGTHLMLLLTKRD